MQAVPSAEALLHSLGVSEPSDIDLEAIAWLRGAKVRYRSLDGCEARIVGRDDRAIITINARSNDARQRFSLGHELGHWERHRGQILMCQSENIGGNNREPPKEAAADRFAADLLMPDFLLRESLRVQKRLDLRTIEAIASEYGVSRSAAGIRLVERDFEPSLLVCHGPGGRKWFVRSASVDQKWFPRDELDASSSAMDVLFGGADDDRFLSTIGADAWFDRYGAERLELKEQSFRTTADEILTLLVLTDESMLAD